MVTYVGEEEGEGKYREKLTERLHHQLTTPLKQNPTMNGEGKKIVVVNHDADEAMEEASSSSIRSAPNVTTNTKG